ncbi:MAG: HAMP domain-containing sensor histidine kinase [Anaerolineales bacterium]|nr:HAMP domain-containing sensor histidine kinase [Anaerolineales bacterium]
MNKFEFPEQLDLAEFISEEAHDLKSPFNRILGFTKMLMKGMSGPITDMQRDDLSTVFQNGSQAMSMMSNLVDMARLSRGEKSFTPSESEANRLLNQMAAYWKQNKADKAVEFKIVSFAPEIPLTADEPLLRQGLLNLALYLAEYSQLPAQITINVEQDPQGLLFSLESHAKKNPIPVQIDLTMCAYIGQAIVKLHGGHFRKTEGNEESGLIQFVLPV